MVPSTWQATSIIPINASARVLGPGTLAVPLSPKDSEFSSLVLSMLSPSLLNEEITYNLDIQVQHFFVLVDLL